MMTPNQPLDDDEVEGALRSLQPVATDLDVSSVFYQAGYQAAVAEQSTPHSKTIVSAVLGAILATAIVAPVGYRAGASQHEVAEILVPEKVEAVAETDFKPPQGNAAESREPEVVDVDEGGDTTTARPLFQLLAGGLFPDKQDRTEKPAETLTAFHASLLKPGDIARDWPEMSFGIENRYETFAQQPPTTRTKTLAISDTINLAENLGDF